MTDRHTLLPPVPDGPASTAGFGVAGPTLCFSGQRLEYVGEVAPLHVHHADDEVWHVLSGTLLFRFAAGEVPAEAGSTMFVPAGVPHTWGNMGPGAARFLFATTPRIEQLIAELHRVDESEHPAVFRRYESELLE